MASSAPCPTPDRQQEPKIDKFKSPEAEKIGLFQRVRAAITNIFNAVRRPTPSLSSLEATLPKTQEPQPRPHASALPEVRSLDNIAPAANVNSTQRSDLETALPNAQETSDLSLPTDPDAGKGPELVQELVGAQRAKEALQQKMPETSQEAKEWEKRLSLAETGVRGTEAPTPGEIAEHQRLRDQNAGEEKLWQEAIVEAKKDAKLSKLVKGAKKMLLGKNIKVRAQNGRVVETFVNQIKTQSVGNNQNIILSTARGDVPISKSRGPNSRDNKTLIYWNIREEFPLEDVLKLNPEFLLDYLKERFSENQKFTYWDASENRQVEATFLELNDANSVIFSLPEKGSEEMTAIEFFKLAPEPLSIQQTAQSTPFSGTAANSSAYQAGQKMAA